MDEDRVRNAVQEAVGVWFGDMTTTLGPQLSTEAYGTFAAQRQALADRITAAVLATQSQPE